MSADRPAATLWIVPKWPLPSQDGARVATFQLVSRLCRLGHPIELVAIVNPGESIDPEEAKRELGVRAVHLIRTPMHPGGGMARWASLGRALVLHPSLPITVTPYASRAAGAALEKLLRSPWRAVVYDGLHPAAHSSGSGLYQRPSGNHRIVYRAHNFESDLWMRKSERAPRPWARRLLRGQAALLRRFEQSVLQGCDAVAPVSQDDLVLLRELSPRTLMKTVPISQDFSSPLPAHSGPDLMFLGRLDWPPNRDGLRWFLDTVWGEAVKERPELRLTVAGSGDSDWMKEYLGLPGLRFLGRIESTETLYAASAASLVPVFYGSGTRVKVIEASRHARACISTALGVEGTGLRPGTDYYSAETREEWLEALRRFDSSVAARVGREAHERMKPAFDADKAAEIFASLLDNGSR